MQSPRNTRIISQKLWAYSGLKLREFLQKSWKHVLQGLLLCCKQQLVASLKSLISLSMKISLSVFILLHPLFFVAFFFHQPVYYLVVGFSFGYPLLFQFFQSSMLYLNVCSLFHTQHIHKPIFKGFCA